MGTLVVADTLIENCTENSAVDLTETWDLMVKTTSVAGATVGDPTLETIGEKGTEKEEEALGEGVAAEIQIIEDGDWDEDGKMNSLNHTV